MMSKLAHSNQTMMDQLDREAAIRDGNEDLIPSEEIARQLREVLKSVAVEYMDTGKLSGSTQIMIANALDMSRD